MKKRKTDQKKIKQILQICGSLLSIGLFVFLLSKQNWSLVYQIIKQMPFWVIPSSLVLIFGGQIFNTWRWRTLIQSQKVEIPFIETFKIIIAGAYTSNFLPSTIGGDAFRIAAMLSYAQSKVVVVSSVLLDRAINVASMLSLAPLIFLVFDVGTFIRGNAYTSLVSANFINSKWNARLQKISSKILTSLKESLQLWSRTPLVIMKAFIISWFSSITVFMGVWTLAWGIRIPVSVIDVSAVSVIVYILTLLPISMNGLGLREVAVTTLYIQLGASLEQASILAIITRFLSLISTLPGAIWLYRDFIAGPFDR